MFRTADYQRGYDAGYKQGLLDALKQRSVDYSGHAHSEQLKREQRRWNGK
jgi:hypothetical protein